MNEMSESISISNQIVNNITLNNKYNSTTFSKQSDILPHAIMKQLNKEQYNKTKKHSEKTKMEQVIYDFKK